MQKTKARPLIRLNIGGGDQSIFGWFNIDRKNGYEAYPLPKEITFADYSTDRPYEKTFDLSDGSVDEIRASHVLEHFPISDIPKVIAEWVRVLRPGGTIKIAVPDFAKAIELSEIDHKWDRYIMGGQTDENDFHHAIFTEQKLMKLMEDAGLTHLKKWESDFQDCASLPVSLNISGIKIAYDQNLSEVCVAERPKNGSLSNGSLKTSLPKNQQQTAKKELAVNIKAILSLPRLIWTDTFGCINEAITSLGIPLGTYGGAYWNQHLQFAMESCVDSGVEWILSLDYDTLFTKSNVQRLMRTMAEHPEIDALAALQPKRYTGTPLAGVAKGGKYEMNGPFKVQHAHFGLTIIRASALKDIPKPWLFSIPNFNGSWKLNPKDKSAPEFWRPIAEHFRDYFSESTDREIWDGENHIDADIYFWKLWEKFGKSVYIDPLVRVGHLEVMASCLIHEEEHPGGPISLKHKHVQVKDWRDWKYYYES